MCIRDSINTAMLNAQKRKNAIGQSPETIPKTGKPKRQSTLYGSYNNTVGAPRQHYQDEFKRTNPQGNSPAKIKIQQQARGPNNTCVICDQDPHRYQLLCPKLKKMPSNQIYKIMTNAGIECQMCLGLGHRTRDCPAVQDGFLKKCSVKENDNECGKYHCWYLHKQKRASEESKEEAQPKLWYTPSPNISDVRPNLGENQGLQCLSMYMPKNPGLPRTLICQIVTPSRMVPVRALVDPGSQFTAISKAIATKLGLKVQEEP